MALGLNRPSLARAVRRRLKGAGGALLGSSVLLLGGGLILLGLGFGALETAAVLGLFAFALGITLLLDAARAPRLGLFMPRLFDRTPAARPEGAGEVSEKAARRYAGELFDTLPVALLWLDERGHILRSNAAARSLLAFSESETVRLQDLVEGLGRSMLSWLKAARESERAIKPEMVQAARARGDRVLQVSLVRPPRAADGSLVAVIGDATELTSLKAQFVQSQKMQAIGQLAGGVAHDFNNLLTAISGYCDLLLLRHEQGDPDHADLLQIRQNANRAASLVQHLLAFSRKQTLTPRPVSVNQIVSDMSHLMNRLLGEKVALTATHARDLPPAYVDPRQLEQVILNLVLNARDAMPEGGEVRLFTELREFEHDTTIQRATVPRGRYVAVRVADSGIGITPEHLERIFEPFFSTKEEGKGTGLGLSTVYGIVKQTGGFIFCESTPGQGSEFTVLLPAHDGEPAQAPEPAATRSAPADLRGRVVLLVEDEAPVRSFSARALRMLGLTVLEAPSGERAMELVGNPEQRIDLIVSDVIMPGVDGPTWVREARRSRPDVRVIFVSGYAEASFGDALEEIEGAEFLPKPYSLKQLVEKVRTLCA